MEMRSWRPVAVWVLVVLGFVVVPATPANACSFTWHYAAPPVQLPTTGTAPAGTTTSTRSNDRFIQRFRYSGTVSAVGDHWIDVEPDFVEAGHPLGRLNEDKDPFGGPCGPAPWQASGFSVGWPVVVSGSVDSRAPNDALVFIDVAPSLEDASAAMRSHAGEVAPLTGEGAAVVVVGGWYGGATATILDAMARPLRYVHGTVTAQVLAPCPESQLVVIAGTNEDESGVVRYAIEVLDTASGKTTPIAIPGLGPFDDEDGTYPWDVACRDASADRIEVSTKFAGKNDAPRPKTNPSTPKPGRYGERVSFIGTGIVPSDPAAAKGVAPMETGSLELNNADRVPPMGGIGWYTYGLRWHPRDGGPWHSVIPGVDALALTRVVDPALGALRSYEKFWPDPEPLDPLWSPPSSPPSPPEPWLKTSARSLLVGDIVVTLGLAAVVARGWRRRRRVRGTEEIATKPQVPP